jgi:hypothetical protein
MMDRWPSNTMKRNLGTLNKAVEMMRVHWVRSINTALALHVQLVEFPCMDISWIQLNKSKDKLGQWLAWHLYRSIQLANVVPFYDSRWTPHPHTGSSTTPGNWDQSVRVGTKWFKNHIITYNIYRSSKYIIFIKCNYYNHLKLFGMTMEKST